MMTTRPHSHAARIAAMVTLLAVPTIACNTGDVAQVDGGAADSGASDAAPSDTGTTQDTGADAGVLRWFTTCGDPVCRPPSDAGSTSDAAAPCVAEHAGDICSNAGAECDPGSGCGVLLRCAATDPKLGYGCPVSTRSAKDDIRYLNGQDLEQVAARLEKIRLATYAYKTDPSKREHLGFIIEDDPASVAVADGKTQVDLYGYTSMVVAAMKVQSRKLAKQDAELAALRLRLEALEKTNEAPSKR